MQICLFRRGGGSNHSVWKSLKSLILIPFLFKLAKSRKWVHKRQILNAILPFLGIYVMKLKTLNWDILANFKTLWSLYVYYLLCTRKFLNASVEILLVKVSFKEIPHYHFTAFFAFVISTMCGPVFAVAEKSRLLFSSASKFSSKVCLLLFLLQ